MAQGDKEYREIWGVVVGVRRPKEGQQDDKTYVSVKSLSTGKYVSLTVWDNSHGAYAPDGATPIEVGGLIFATGSFQQNTGNDGNVYNNISAYKLAYFPVDAGVRDDDRPRSSSSSSGPSDDDDGPGVM